MIASALNVPGLVRPTTVESSRLRPDSVVSGLGLVSGFCVPTEEEFTTTPKGRAYRAHSLNETGLCGNIPGSGVDMTTDRGQGVGSFQPKGLL